MNLSWAQDSTVRSMTEDTTPATTNLLYTVKDPGGSPLDRKVTIGNLLAIKIGTVTDGMACAGDSSGKVQCSGGAITATSYATSASDGNNKITLSNNTAIAPTASVHEWYIEANLIKYNQNGTEYASVLGPSGANSAAQITITGPTAARVVTLPDAAVTIPANPMGGTLGATTNVIPKASGTGTATLQASGITEDGTNVSLGALNLVTTGIVKGKINAVPENTATTYNVTVAEAQSGTFFTNINAGTKTFVLPAAEAGMSVCVKNGQGVVQILRIDTDGTDYIVMSTGARTSAAGDYYSCAASAACQVCVVAFDATDWQVTSERGTWTEE